MATFSPLIPLSSTRSLRVFWRRNVSEGVYCHWLWSKLLSTSSKGVSSFAVTGVGLSLYVGLLVGFGLAGTVGTVGTVRTGGRGRGVVTVRTVDFAGARVTIVGTGKGTGT